MTLIPNAPLVVSYNGVTFPVETETTDVSIKPIADAAGRAVKYILYSITLRSILGQANQLSSGSGGTTDSTMESLRKRLTAYGGEFHYEAVGLGALVVNAGGDGAKDVIWGPKPTMLKWKPLGQLACEIVWTVEVAIPECDSASYAFRLMEFCFKLAVDKDRSGYSRRTYSGFLRIPQTRASVTDRTLSDTADAYLEQIYPPPMIGFRRIPGKATLSEDKCRLDFEVTDEEMTPNMPPAGVIDPKASMTISTPSAIAGKQWTATISAIFEMARDWDNGAALAYFVQMVNDRLGQGAFLGQIKAVIPLALTIAEPEIYGRNGAAFSMTFTVLSSLADIVKDSGLWRPIPNTSWAAWSQSLAGSAFHARGNAKLKVGNDVDAIIDLCQPAGEYSLRGGLVQDQVLSTAAGQLLVAYPSRGSSWLRYQSDIHFEDLDECYELKTLPSSPGSILSTEAFPQFFGGAGYVLSTGGGSGSGNTTGSLEKITVSPSPNVVVQRRAEPSRYCWLTGAAVRAGYPVDVPDLLSVGGVAPVRACRMDMGEGVWHKTETALFGIPVYSARWNVRYLIPGRPVQADVPSMPYV